MSPQDLTSAIITGITDGGEQFLEGTLAAVLPIIWLVLLGLHLSRPYILDMIDRFTLRLGADLLWLIYIALRDLLIVSGVIMSFMFFFPDVVTAVALPLTGGLAAASLFAVLLVKLIGDPDHNLRDFRLTTVLLVVGATLCYGPLVFAVEAADQSYLSGFSQNFTSSTNVNVALPIMWISLVGAGLVTVWLFVHAWNAATRSMEQRMTAQSTRATHKKEPAAI
jgi:hypothetical protein